MNVDKSKLSRLGLCLLVTSVVVSNQALGQSVSTSAPFDIPTLANVIENSFSLVNTKAHVGNDWCVQVETDANENWWYVPDNGTPVARQGLYGNRLRLIYRTNDDKVVGPASIFIAVDLLKGSVYTLNALTGPTTSNQTGVPSGLPKNLGTIIFPDSLHSVCPTFPEFLAAVFQNDIESWTPVGDPTCDDVASQCTSYQGSDGQPHANKESFLPGCDPKDVTKCKIVYWNFNGRIHKISGVIRFLIKVHLQGAPPNTFVSGYLMVGFGGNGSAG